MATGKIIGVVRDKTDAASPIVGAVVTVSPARGAAAAATQAGCGPVTAVTQQDGSYQVDVEAGYSYRVEATAFQKNAHLTVKVDEAVAARADLELNVGIAIEFSITANGASQTSESATEGQVVVLRASCSTGVGNVIYTWQVSGGRLVEQGQEQNQKVVNWDTRGVEGVQTATLTVSESNTAAITVSKQLTVLPRPLQRVALETPVSLQRAEVKPAQGTALPFWLLVRRSTDALSFDNYLRFMDLVLCNKQPPQDMDPIERAKIVGDKKDKFANLRNRRFLPFNDVDAYRLLKVATEAFVVANCAVAPDLQSFPFTVDDVAEAVRRVDLGDVNGTFDLANLDTEWSAFLQDVSVNGQINGQNFLKTILYLKLIRDKLPDVRLKNSVFTADDADLPEECFGILKTKLTNPCMLELIWSYWQEEGMLVQTGNVISRRFQNIRGPGERDPLAMLEIDPLRPLNNLLWGYIQDEQHRLSLVRRVYEYDHHYGMTLLGKAVPPLRPADSRSKFLESFHNLLYVTAIFFKEDDDTTVKADGFPVLNAIKDVHILLTEGAHNQFGDLPSTARQEMLVQQWLLARPEFREFLPTRTMVAYPEPWMDRVDAMKTLQGWTDVSIMHFRDLAVFGEKLLLSIRFGAWSKVFDADEAKIWARFWRSEIQGYIHAYRAVTGVDLTVDVADASQALARTLPPSVHLQKRLALQRGRGQLGYGPAGYRIPVLSPAGRRTTPGANA